MRCIILFHMKTHPIIYTSIWSVMLFVSTFPKVIFDCDTSALYTSDIKSSIFTPIGLVLALYMWEEMYNINTVNISVDKLKRTVWWTFGVLSIVLTLLVIIINIDTCRMLPFILSWIFISILKYISISILNNSTELNKVM